MTRWVTSLWLLALSVLRVNVRGLSCRTPDARANSTGAVLGQVSYGSCAILGENIVRVGLRSYGDWRSECCESVFLAVVLIC